MRKRLQEFLSEMNLSAREFAEKIGVQPSSVSHILTGRNKPSIDFLEKFIAVYPEVDLNYVVSGEKRTVEALPKEESDARENNEVDEKGLKQSDSKEKRIILLNEDGSYTEFKPISDEKSVS